MIFAIFAPPLQFLWTFARIIYFNFYLFLLEGIIFSGIYFWGIIFSQVQIFAVGQFLTFHANCSFSRVRYLQYRLIPKLVCAGGLRTHKQIGWVNNLKTHKQLYKSGEKGCEGSEIYLGVRTNFAREGVMNILGSSPDLHLNFSIAPALLKFSIAPELHKPF